MNNNVKMSQREYAEYIGVSEGAVRKAIGRKDLVIGFDAATKTIDPVLAEKNDWVQQQKIIKNKPGVGTIKTTERLDKNFGGENFTGTHNGEDKEIPKDIVENLSTDELLAMLKLTPTMTTQSAIRINEIIDAALNKKKLEEQEGILVRRDKVERALFVLGSELKKALFNMPQRVVRDIRHAASEVEAMNIINAELTLILDNYGNLQPNTLN